MRGHRWPQSIKAHVTGLFDWLVPVALRFLRREVREAAPTLDANCVVTAMRTISGLTAALAEPEGYAAVGDARALQQVEAAFLFAMVWSVGATGADINSRRAFDAFMRAAVACELPSYDSPSGEK